tara:strand:+ start:3204 stop:3599 length:396 start_codon:yes stop_codon:yes gene_type:complete
MTNNLFSSFLKDELMKLNKEEAEKKDKDKDEGEGTETKLSEAGAEKNEDGTEKEGKDKDVAKASSDCASCSEDKNAKVEDKEKADVKLSEAEVAAGLVISDLKIQLSAKKEENRKLLLALGQTAFEKLGEI